VVQNTLGLQKILLFFALVYIGIIIFEGTLPLAEHRTIGPD
jgi:hypothetical protein